MNDLQPMFSEEIQVHNGKILAFTKDELRMAKEIFNQTAGDGSRLLLAHESATYTGPIVYQNSSVAIQKIDGKTGILHSFRLFEKTAEGVVNVIESVKDRANQLSVAISYGKDLSVNISQVIEAQKAIGAAVQNMGGRQQEVGQ